MLVYYESTLFHVQCKHPNLSHHHLLPELLKWPPHLGHFVFSKGGYLPCYMPFFVVTLWLPHQKMRSSFPPSWLWVGS